MDTYVNNQTKIRVKHIKCGNVYKVTPANFLKGNRCSYCNGNVKKTDVQFKQEVKNLVGTEYTFLDLYVNDCTKLKVKHNTCGNVYKVKPSNFLQGQRCPFCSTKFNFKKTDAQFKKEVYSLVGGEYTFLDSYVNDRTKLKVKHTKCGNVYEVRPYSFLTGSRCPYCNSPKGETIITKILDDLDINYDIQKNI